MMTIILLDETTGRRLLRKPGIGAPCNGCGYCCAATPCGLAREYLSATEVGPCPALECEGGLFRCGLIGHASHYMDVPNDWADPILGALFAEALGTGKGCDADDP